jgi:hypothetical protein
MNDEVMMNIKSIIHPLIQKKKKKYFINFEESQSRNWKNTLKKQNQIT